MRERANASVERELGEKQSGGAYMLRRFGVVQEE